MVSTVDGIKEREVKKMVGLIFGLVFWKVFFLVTKDDDNDADWWNLFL